MQHRKYVHDLAANPMNDDVWQAGKSRSLRYAWTPRHRNDQQTPNGFFDPLYDALCGRWIIVGEVVVYGL